jgi:hypothetical protein
MLPESPPLPPRPKSSVEVGLTDPLSEVTRSERKSLLGVSAAVVTVVHVGLVPTQISALGIDFNPGDQRTLVRMTALITLYFLLTFAAYAWSDYFASYHADRANYREWLAYRAHPGARESDEKAWQEMRERGFPLPFYAKVRRPVVTSVRGLIDFAFPILFGVYAVIAALLYVPAPIVAPQRPNAAVTSAPATQSSVSKAGQQPEIAQKRQPE